MDRQTSRFRCIFGCLGAMALAVAGCRQSDNVHYLGDAELKHYRKVATKVDYPCVQTVVNDDALVTEEPRRLGNLRKDELWDMPLFEAVRLALANNPIIRNRSQFLRPGTAPVSDSASVYDPAIVESETIFGQQGVEAALSEFDAQLTTSMIWGKEERIQNNAFLSGGLAPGATLQQDTGAFRSQLQKTMATGGQATVRQNWDYLWANNPGQLFPSTYIGTLEAEYRHPLWQGAGTEFTRIAGPVLRRDPFRATVSLDQGVVVGRIRTDMNLADFQASIRNLLKDVEDVYWDLYLTYQIYDGEAIARNSALQTWREVKGREKAGLPGGAASDEAQARDNYFEARARTEQALADIYDRETQLRRLIGLPVNDGKIIRPCDDPVTAEYLPDWHASLAEALTLRAELRKQKWQIKSFELQLVAAKSLAQPRFDFVSRYRVNGFGDDLLGQNDNDGVTQQGLESAYETLAQGDQTGWNLGFEFSMPLGFRAALSQQKNIELRLARARTQLATQELEISHELSSAFQGMGRWHTVMRTNFSRLQAADDRVKAFDADYRAGRLPAVDLLLRAQISRAQANNEYYRSLVEYNKSIANLHLRKETLLEHNNVHLAESGWKPEAYAEAMRRAWARSHACEANCLDTVPAEFARSSPLPVAPVEHVEAGYVEGIESEGVATDPGAGTQAAPPPAPAGAPPVATPPLPPGDDATGPSAMRRHSIPASPVSRATEQRTATLSGFSTDLFDPPPRGPAGFAPPNDAPRPPDPNAVSDASADDSESLSDSADWTTDPSAGESPIMPASEESPAESDESSESDPGDE